MTKKAVLYARVSGDDTKYATSGIDGQLDDCRKYALSKGYEVVGEYFEERDLQTSGAEWLPELMKIIDLANQGVLDVLVVREIDRLARNRFKQLSTEIDLEAAGVKIEYVIGQFEDSAEGRLLKGMMSEFAEYEREKIKERMVRGIEKSILQGNVKFGGCSAPYGYDVEKLNGKRLLVINEFEAEIVVLIFDLYVRRRYSRDQIAAYLDENNIPKPMKGAAHRANLKKKKNLGWSAGTLGGILENEAYVGRWYYRKSKSIKNPKTGKRKHVPRPKSEWLLVNVPAIIDEAIFQAAAERKERNKREMGKNRKFFYGLGGMVRCGLCNISASGFSSVQGDKFWSYYRCNTRANKIARGGTCALPYFRADEVDAAVWRWVKGILLDPERLNQAFEDYQQKTMEAHLPTLRMIEGNQNRIKQLEQEKARLKTAYRNGIIQLDEFAQDRGTIDKEIKDLTQAIKQLREELGPKMLTQEDIDTIEAFTAHIRQGSDLTDDDPEFQREIFQTLNVEVTLFEEDGEKWVHVSCLLGQVHSHIGSVPNDRTSACRGGNSAPAGGSIQRGCPFRQYGRFQSPGCGWRA